MRWILFYLLILSLCSPLKSEAQNLIRNGDFKDSVVGSFGVLKAKHWSSATRGGSPDYFHPDSRVEYRVPLNFAGFQEAKKERAYMGIGLFSPSISAGFREYIQNELISPLEKDSIYCVQFYMSLADSMNYALKNMIGIYFSNQRLNVQTSSVLQFSPQIEFIDTTFFLDDSSWIQMRGQYVASGGEKYLIVGNFREDQNLDTLNRLGSGKPEDDNAYYYLDDFFLGHCDSLPEDTAIGLRELKPSKLTIYPNPSNGVIQIIDKNHQFSIYEIYNISGKVINSGAINGRSVIITENFPPGIYLIKLAAEKGVVTRKIVVE